MSFKKENQEKEAFESIYSGYVGLAPIDADPTNKKYNFLY